jgi:exopolysaccharide biosynthesis protein
MKILQFVLLFLLAPVIGFYFGFYETNPYDLLRSDAAVAKVDQTEAKLEEISTAADNTNKVILETKNDVKNILETANLQQQTLKEQQKQLEVLMVNSQSQTLKSDIVLEKILSDLLGDPVQQHNGKRSTIKVYSLKEAGYRGYMAKVRVHQSDALELVLADDKVVSNGETPSEAAKRKNAILAVNAGGFWKTEDGKMAPLGITVVDGEIKTFYENRKLSFVGFNRQGHLVGGKINTKKELEQLNVLQGSSFVPTLLQDGKKAEIPKEWKNTRHPRTIVGNFSNGELLFVTIDGRRKGWSGGVTLEELQDKLLSFKIKDAFNLDGGGSSAFYFNGKVLNRPSDGRQRPVTSNIVILP